MERSARPDSLTEIVDEPTVLEVFDVTSFIPTKNEGVQLIETKTIAASDKKTAVKMGADAFRLAAGITANVQVFTSAKPTGREVIAGVVIG